MRSALAIAILSIFTLHSTLVRAEEAPKLEKLVVAGGCFWCVEKDFEKVKGVVSAESVYTGGSTDNPDYKSVSKGGTGHYEGVVVAFDPTQVSRKDLVHFFWRTIDPLDPKGQFCDKGESYRSALFYSTESEKALMEQSLKEAQEELSKKFSGQKIQTKILGLKEIFKAEEYHQDYYKKNPIRYRFYRSSCGRDSRLEKLWGEKAGVFVSSSKEGPSK